MDIPRENHVTRYVPYKKLLTDIDGNVLGILPQAFELREGEKNLSTNWIEYFKCDTEEENMKLVIQDFPLNVNKKSLFSIGKVSDVLDACTMCDESKVKIVHDGKRGNPSHCSIIRMSGNNSNLMEVFAAQVFERTFPPY